MLSNNKLFLYDLVSITWILSDMVFWRGGIVDFIFCNWPKITSQVKILTHRLKYQKICINYKSKKFHETKLRIVKWIQFPKVFFKIYLKFICPMTKLKSKFHLHVTYDWQKIWKHHFSMGYIPTRMITPIRSEAP